MGQLRDTMPNSKRTIFLKKETLNILKCSLSFKGCCCTNVINLVLSPISIYMCLLVDF